MFLSKIYQALHTKRRYVFSLLVLAFVVIMAGKAYTTRATIEPMGSHAVQPVLFEKEVYPGLVLESGFIRLMPPSIKSTAAYISLRNDSNASFYIKGIEAESIAEVVELHQHENIGDVMRMVKLKQFEVPANDMLALQPGGKHLMVKRLLKPLTEGQKVSMTVLLGNGTSFQVLIPVRRQ